MLVICRAHLDAFLSVGVGVHGKVFLWIWVKKKNQPLQIILTLDLTTLTFNEVLTIDFFEIQSNNKVL